MAAKLISRVVNPLGHFLRSSALSSVRIAAVPLAEAEALRRSLFDTKAQRLVADGRLWALSSDSSCVKTRGSRRVLDDKEQEQDDDDFDSAEDDEDYDGEVDFGDDDDDNEFYDDELDNEEDDVNDAQPKRK